jgi:hypothetical protein
MERPPSTRISKKQAAERLGCSTRKIDRLRTAGELVAVKSSREQQGHIEITLDSLEAYEQRQLQAAGPRPARDDLKARLPNAQIVTREAVFIRPNLRARGADLFVQLGCDVDDLGFVRVSITLETQAWLRREQCLLTVSRGSPARSSQRRRSWRTKPTIGRQRATRSRNRSFRSPNGRPVKPARTATVRAHISSARWAVARASLRTSAARERTADARACIARLSATAAASMQREPPSDRSRYAC